MYLFDNEPSPRYQSITYIAKPRNILLYPVSRSPASQLFGSFVFGELSCRSFKPYFSRGFMQNPTISFQEDQTFYTFLAEILCSTLVLLAICESVETKRDGNSKIIGNIRQRSSKDDHLASVSRTGVKCKTGRTCRHTHYPIASRSTTGHSCLQGC